MNIENVCRHFKLMQENCDLEIQFYLKHCYVHKREKALILLNFNNNKSIDIKTEGEKLKEYLNYLLIENSGWFFVSSGQKYFKRSSRFRFENVVEFIIRRDYSLTV